MNSHLSRNAFFRSSLLGACLLAACSSHGDQNVEDMALPPEPPDLRGAPDFSGLDLSGTADMRTGVTSCRGTDAPGVTLKEATNNILLPKSSGTMAYTYDYDGDGRTENQLKSLVQALSLGGFDLQGALNSSVTSGSMVYLIGVTTLKLDTSTCTGVILNNAVPRAPGNPPKYDGTDLFVKAAGPDAELAATVAAGMLSTKASKDLTKLDEPRIDLKLDLGIGAITLPLHGVHIQGTLNSVGGKLFIQDGVLHGVVSKKDLDTSIVPAIAMGITKQINSDPMSSTTMTLISLFENMMNPVTKTKCMVAADCCKLSPSTCKILPEEVQASPIGGVLAPDVQVFNDMDQWSPTPGGSKKNGMSVGIGFSSVPASF